MPWRPTTDKRLTELAHGIKQKIMQRSGGRIEMLEVEVSENLVVIHGCTASYYFKQLALRGALDALGSSETLRIELDIQVQQPAVTHSNA